MTTQVTCMPWVGTMITFCQSHVLQSFKLKMYCIYLHCTYRIRILRVHKRTQKHFTMSRDTQIHTFIVVSQLVLYCIDLIYNTITVQNTFGKEKKNPSMHNVLCIYGHMFGAHEQIVNLFLFSLKCRRQKSTVLEQKKAQP